jgi:arylsulfatase A
VVKAGSKTQRITSLVDFYATCADIVGAEQKATEGVDSVSFYPTLEDPVKVDRAPIVMHSIGGMFAIRQGRWKLCFCGGSGGWSAPKKAKKGDPKWQLFDLEADPAETTNLYTENPEKVEQLHVLMKQYIQQGRSTPGPAQKNDAKIVLIKEKE